MRPPSAACTWCSGTSWSSIAEYTFTGTLTRPKVSAPFQIALIAPSTPVAPAAPGGLATAARLDSVGRSSTSADAACV
jgi:hypothetical protein